MTTAFIASTQPPNPKMPTDTEPANAALPTLDPQAQELARLKALVATQAEEILYVKKQAAMRCGASRAQTTKFEALSGDYAKLLEANAQLLEANTEPATAALPILDPQAHPRDDYLDPQAQELERLKALVARQALRHAVVTKQAGRRSVDARAMRDRIEALSRDHAKLQEKHAELGAKYTGTLEQLAEARQRELDFNSSVRRGFQAALTQMLRDNDLQTMIADLSVRFCLSDLSVCLSVCVSVCLSDLSVGPLCVRQATPRKRPREDEGEERDTGGPAM